MQSQKGGYKLEKIDFGKYVEVPDNWKIYSLSDLCRVRKSNSIESELYIGLEHIGQGTNKLESRGNVNHFTSTKNVFVKGDVLYGKLRPLLNKVWLATHNGYCSTDILPLIPNEKVLDVIMMYILSSSRFVAYATSRSAGTKMPRINWTDIMKFKIPLPPLEEQQRIASILSKVDDLILKTDEIIEQTQRLKKGLTQRLLTGGIGHKSFKNVKFLYGKEIAIPEEWRVLRIDSLVKNKNDIKTGPFGSSLKKEFFVSKGYKVYGQEQVITDNFEIGDYYIPEDLFVKMKNYEIRPRDVLISLVGTHGKISIVPSNIERGIINPRLLKVTFDQSVALPEFMKIVLSSKLTDIQIQRLSHGLTMDILNLGLMKKITFFIPSIAEQQKIVNIISRLENLLAKLQDYVQSLNILKKGLMQKLLTGTIRVKV